MTLERTQTVLISGSSGANLSTYENQISNSVEARVSLTLEDTINHLTNRDIYTLGLFVVKSQVGADYIDHIRAAHQHNPGLPIYLINLDFKDSKVFWLMHDNSI